MSALPYDIGVDSGDPFGFNGSVDYTANIVDLNSAGLASSFTFPPPFSSLSMSLAWPNLTTNGGVTPASPDMLSSTRASNNFPRLNPDVDQALTNILFGGINPFDVNTPFVAGDAHIELADLDLNGGLNFIQAFALKEPGLTGLIRFENGASQTFTFGSDILLPNASSIDLAGNHDGKVDFNLFLDPQATLQNMTDLGFNVGYNFDFLKVSGHYDVLVDSGDFSVGPAAHAGGTLPIGTVNVYNNTFNLDFAPKDVLFHV